MRGKKEYPKMIYKGGKVSTKKEDYFIVYDETQHMEMLEMWGDKRPDTVAKPKKVDKVETKPVAADSEKTEEKPRRGRKKAASKG